MQLHTIFMSLTANARFGVIALLIGGVGLAITVWIPGAGPMRLLTLGMLIFGQWCYAQEAGLEKPLSKLVLVALSFAGLGFVLFELDGNPKAALLFAFSGFLSVLFWSVALLHRPGRAKTAGKIGAMAGGASIAVLIGGHVFVGFGAALGLGVLRSTTTSSADEVVGLVAIVGVVAGIWSVIGACVILTGLLKAGITDEVLAEP